jgi:hypothetical protein
MKLRLYFGAIKKYLHPGQVLIRRRPADGLFG